MNTGDTVWTIAGFVLVGLGVLAVVGIAPFLLMMGDSSQGKQYAKLEGFLVAAAVVGPPLVIVGIYVAAIVLAWRASGPTAHYPWIVLVVAVPLWFAMVGGIEYAKGNLMHWLPRSKGDTADGPTWVGAPQTSRDALDALGQWAAEHGDDVVLSRVHTDRFPYGWTIYTPSPNGPDNPQAVLDTGAGPVYLVGDSGAITTVTSGDLQRVHAQFCREEIRRRARG